MRLLYTNLLFRLCSGPVDNHHLLSAIRPCPRIPMKPMGTRIMKFIIPSVHCIRRDRHQISYSTGVTRTKVSGLRIRFFASG